MMFIRKQWRIFIRTMYKRKNRKIFSINVPLPNDVNPNSLSSSSLSIIIGEKIFHGSRLTSERLATMKIGIEFLSPTERQLFIDILFEYEAAVAFDESEMRLFDPSIESLVIIHTIPHAP